MKRFRFFLMKVVSVPLFLFMGACDFNPSFSSLIENAMDPEVQKGFFGFSVVFPSLYGTENASEFTLHPLEGGADVLQLKKGWLDDAPDDKEEGYRKLYAVPDTHKIRYGTYRLTLKIGNPLTRAVHETEIWIRPGRSFEYIDRFREDEFK